MVKSLSAPFASPASDPVEVGKEPLCQPARARDREPRWLPRQNSVPMKCIFSVDVEEWFHILDIPSAPKISQWDALPSLVEPSFMKLLDILSGKDAHVTWFFLGWVAERYPHLVREARQRGHEIASHGYSHRLVYLMTPEEFLE